MAGAGSPGGGAPCPAPGWAPTWQLNRSTLCMPGAGGTNGDGFLDAAAAARFGIVCLDWAVAQAVWNPPGTSKFNMTGGSTLVEQCRAIKAVDGSTKCMVYRNAELALSWHEEQRAAMYDPRYADFFLRLPNGTIYNERGGCAGCDQYFWNWTNPSAVAWALANSEQGPLGTGSPFVDGTFLDDSQGLPIEHPRAPAALNLTAAEVLAYADATQDFTQRVVEALAAGGGALWQSLQTRNTGDPDYFTGSAPGAGNCAAWMAAACAPEMQAIPLTLAWPYNSTEREAFLAAFLVARGPYAWVGHQWRCEPRVHWDALWDLDVGEPRGPCAEVAPGVFARNYTRGVAAINCSSFEGTLDF